MKGKMTIAGVDVELDAAAIPQLYTDLDARGIVVSHQHHYMIAPLDGDETVEGVCWCGEARRFMTSLDGARAVRPHGGAVSPPGAAPAPTTSPPGDRSRPRCSSCNRNHQRGKPCPA